MEGTRLALACVLSVSVTSSTGFFSRSDIISLRHNVRTPCKQVKQRSLANHCIMA
jgi:hypothetical protein